MEKNDLGSDKKLSPDIKYRESACKTSARYNVGITTEAWRMGVKSCEQISKPIEFIEKVENLKRPTIIVSGIVHFKTINKDMTLNR
jgi:hypothetical protein